MSKNRKLRNSLYKLITVLLVLIIIASGASIVKILMKYWAAKNVYNDTAKVAMEDPNAFDGNIDFGALQAINPDICGWLYQDDSPINYPVVRGEDNDKYLHTLYDGTWNGGGTLFVDCRNNRDFSDFNTIIYGHHMRDGSMFHCLRGYTKEEGYYDGHKTFDLITPDEKYTLVVFSAYIVHADDDLYDLSFETDKEKQAIIDKAYDKSQINTGVEVTKDDRIVMLSTCAYDFDDARYVVLCKITPFEKSQKK